MDDTIAQDLLSGINVSKILTIVGPNASGKSNLLRVLAFMRFWIVDAWRSEVDKRVDHQDVFYRIVPFLDNLEKESKIECVFETKTSQYRIQLVLQ